MPLKVDRDMRNRMKQGRNAIRTNWFKREIYTYTMQQRIWQYICFPTIVQSQNICFSISNQNVDNTHTHTHPHTSINTNNLLGYRIKTTTRIEWMNFCLFAFIINHYQKQCLVALLSPPLVPIKIKNCFPWLIELQSANKQTKKQRLSVFVQ